VRQVDEEGDVVVPVRDVHVEETVLQPVGGERVPEERAIEVDAGARVGSDADVVGHPAREVVGEQEAGEREPVKDHPARPALDVSQRECKQAEQEPDEEPV